MQQSRGVVGANNNSQHNGSWNQQSSGWDLQSNQSGGGSWNQAGGANNSGGQQVLPPPPPPPPSGQAQPIAPGTGSVASGGQTVACGQWPHTKFWRLGSAATASACTTATICCSRW